MNQGSMTSNFSVDLGGGDKNNNQSKRHYPKPKELTGADHDNNARDIKALPFWNERLYKITKSKRETTFTCDDAHQHVKNHVKTVFRDMNDIHNNVVVPMNNTFGQNCFFLKETEKYVKIVCQGKCPYETWYEY
jgi:hypothetical protein